MVRIKKNPLCITIKFSLYLETVRCKHTIQSQAQTLHRHQVNRGKTTKHSRHLFKQVWCSHPCCIKIQLWNEALEKTVHGTLVWDFILYLTETARTPALTLARQPNVHLVWKCHYAITASDAAQPEHWFSETCSLHTAQAGLQLESPASQTPGCLEHSVPQCLTQSILEYFSLWKQYNFMVVI